MSRVFLSHAGDEWRAAVALKQWLAHKDSTLADDIFLDVDPVTGIKVGMPWKEALRQANTRCEAVICLVSEKWEASHECKTEYRVAETLNKQILCARLEPSTGDDLISEWQRCDLFGGESTVEIDIGHGEPVKFAEAGLTLLLEAVRHSGIGPRSFPWPPADDPEREPYRGWEPFEHADAAVFFGRDAQIVRALDAVRGMRLSALTAALFVVLGPSGTGKSSFLRAGLLPRLAREDRRFVVLQTVRPERNALTGERGLAAAIHATRRSINLTKPPLGEIKAACEAEDVARLAELLREIREKAAARLLYDSEDADDKPAPPTLVLPLDQAEELFGADAGDQAGMFLKLIQEILADLNAAQLGMIVAASIRTDRYEVMQTHPQLAGVDTVIFDELKPMPANQFIEVITGPANRATQAGRSLRVAPDLVERLLRDAGEGADTLPMLSLTLSRLYLDYGSSGELTSEQYKTMGGMARVVQTEVDGILSTDVDRRQEELDALRSAFIPWLATINPANNQAMRRVARWEDLPEASRPLIDALVTRRLMVRDTREGQVVVEVALESLLRQWDELAGWLREQGHNLKAADDLENAAEAWAANDHSPDWLLTAPGWRMPKYWQAQLLSVTDSPKRVSICPSAAPPRTSDWRPTRNAAGPNSRLPKLRPGTPRSSKPPRRLTPRTSAGAPECYVRCWRQPPSSP